MGSKLDNRMDKLPTVLVLKITMSRNIVILNLDQTKGFRHWQKQTLSMRRFQFLRLWYKKRILKQKVNIWITIIRIMKI